MPRKCVNSKEVKVVGEDGITRSHEISKTYVVKIDDSDKFFMVYYNMLKSFYEIKYVKDVMLLIKLVGLADHDTGIVTIAARTRDIICEELNVSKPNLSPMFKRLLELELINGDKGVYQINEAVFWKGDAKLRRDLLKDRGLEFILRFTI